MASSFTWGFGGAIVSGLAVVGASLIAAESNTNAKLAKCTSAYYAAGKEDYPNYKAASRNSAFVQCMKAEYPDQFTQRAKQYGLIEEFDADKGNMH